MSANSFQVTNPTLPKEDRPNTTLIKMLIILAIVGGIGWFIYKKSEDGSLGKFFDSVKESLAEDEDEEIGSEATPEVQDKIEAYLSKQYNDVCKYNGAALVKLPDDAEGGRFKCHLIKDVDVFAYVIEDDDEEIFEDSYVYAKYYRFTEQVATGVVRLYFPEAKVELVNSMYEISSEYNKNIMFNDFVRRNKFEYVFRVNLPQGTGIKINDLTAISRQLTQTLPNYQLDGVYVLDIDDDPINMEDNVHVFTIKSKDGEASVRVDQ